MPKSSRRDFLKSASVAVAASTLSPKILRAQPTSLPSRKLNVGIIGTANEGWANFAEVASTPCVNIFAVCDVDSNYLAAASAKFPKAKKFVDFRELLTTPDLDAVVVSTPDHMHAPISSAALRAGKHVYCEKPLTHTIAEARTIVTLAAQKNLVTQMGIQIHAMDNYRRVVELVQSAAIGPIHEVHIWNNRSNHPYTRTPAPPPPTLNYDLWLGVAQPQPYFADMHPFNWRRRWAFGSGLTGDIACHLMDIAFWSLNLTSPTHVEARGSHLDATITPEWIVATYDFPARDFQPPVKLTWYDPPNRPAKLDSWNLPEVFRKEAVAFIGEEGIIVTNYHDHALLPENKFKNFPIPTPAIKHSPGHRRQWAEAAYRGDSTGTSAPFSYGALLTETAHLATIAFRAQKALDWDAPNTRFTNAPEAEKFLSYQYRDGWKL